MHIRITYVMARMFKALVVFFFAISVLNAVALDLRGIGLGMGQQIELQQQQQGTNLRQQCFANCNNNGNCMQGCAAAYPQNTQQQRTDLSCMTRCAEAGSAYDFCKSRCSY